jgi:hypothetical protein
MTNLVIIHFSPIELYPPIQNLILQLENEDSDFKISIITTRNESFDLSSFEIQSERIGIFRYGKSKRNQPTIIRYLNYMEFYGLALRDLIVTKPQRTMYFETLSSLPAYLYKIFIAPTTELFVHYHEYTSPKEYRSLKLFGFLHSLEIRIDLRSSKKILSLS